MPSNTVCLRRTWSLDVLNTVLLRSTPANVYFYLSAHPLGIPWWRWSFFDVDAVLFRCTAGRRWCLHEKVSFCTKSFFSNNYIILDIRPLVFSSSDSWYHLSLLGFLFPVLLLCVSIFLLVTHLFLFRFKLSRSFYHLPILLLIFRFNVRRRLSFWSLFFISQSHYFSFCQLSLFVLVRSALRRLHPHLPVNPISLLVLLSPLRGGRSFSPSSMSSILPPLLSFFLVLSSSQIRSSSNSENHTPSCPSRSLADRIARKRFATTAAAATEQERSARYMGETQKGKKGRIPTAIVGP